MPLGLPGKGGLISHWLTVPCPAPPRLDFPQLFPLNRIFFSCKTSHTGLLSSSGILKEGSLSPSPFLRRQPFKRHTDIKAGSPRAFVYTAFIRRKMICLWLRSPALLPLFSDRFPRMIPHKPQPTGEVAAAESSGWLAGYRGLTSFTMMIK